LRHFRITDGRLVVIAASTLKGEESSVLRAFSRIKRNNPDALLIIAPRHPERFAAVMQLSEQAGFETMRRSDLTIDCEPRVDVVILDTIGELARVYEVGTVVFVGGSLVTAGGHNILEPAVFGKPILFGPHMENFQEIADTFVENGAACQVQSGQELEDMLVKLLADPVRQAGLGVSARTLVEANRGAKDATLAVISMLFPSDDQTAIS